MSKEWNDKAIDVLVRMDKAFNSGRGIRISWEELEVMYRTGFGQDWSTAAWDRQQNPPHYKDRRVTR